MFDWLLNQWITGTVTHVLPGHHQRPLVMYCRRRARTGEIEFRRTRLVDNTFQWAPLHHFWWDDFKADA